ncbi:MAG: FAD-dependent oxidoreductase [Clostridia bacterium]|nr:FAD-dependent oxidoreductase [Clostridia bacterium]
MQDIPSWQSGERDVYPVLRGAHRADVVIVGGGLTGLTLAAMLVGHGIETAVIEARRIACGNTFASTGKVTAQLENIYPTIAGTAGMEAARTYARLMHEAMHGVASLCGEMGVPHAWQGIGVYSCGEADDAALDAIFQAEKTIGLPVGRTGDVGDCPIPVRRAIRLEQQLMMPPVDYALALARLAAQRGCRIWEQSPVRRMEGRRLYTPLGHVEAMHVVLATGYPIGVTHLPLMGMLEQQVGVTRVLRFGAPFHMSHLAAAQHGLNFRPLPDGGMLLSCELQRVGHRKLPDAWKRLNDAQQSLLPDWTQTDEIIRQDVWSGDGLPLIGPVSAKEGHTLVATGYSGWGVANSFLAARVLAGHLLGQPMPEAPLFLPFRRYPGRTLVTAKGGGKAAGALAAGIVRFGAPVCTHMGCRLRYDLESRQWMCPCHGSTFSVLGEPTHGPAMQDANVSHRQRPDA